MQLGRILLAALFSINLLAAAFIVTPQPGEIRNIQASLQGSPYQSFHFTIQNTEGRDVLVAVSLADILYNSEGLPLGQEILRWQGEYINTISGAYFVNGLNSYSDLTVSSKQPAIFIPNGATVDIGLGILVSFIPTVQAPGKYVGNLEFEVVN